MSAQQVDVSIGMCKQKAPGMKDTESEKVQSRQGARLTCRVWASMSGEEVWGVGVSGVSGLMA